MKFTVDALPTLKLFQLIEARCELWLMVIAALTGGCVWRMVALPAPTTPPVGRVVGAGGLGQLLYVELSLFHYAQASTVIIAMLALSMAVDQASAWLRIKMR